MLVLAVDTTTRQGIAALIRDGRLLSWLAGDASRTHAERLPGDLIALLAREGLSVRDVDLFGVAAGPGSFTGLRVGIATIQGLAFALARQVVPVPVLDVLAQVGAGWDGFGAPSPCPTGTAIGVAMDAQRREVFSALFGVAEPAAAGPAVLEVLEPPVAEPPGATASRWGHKLGAAPTVLAGDGAFKYRTLFRDHLPAAVLREGLPPLAPLIGVLAELAARSGRAVSPHAVRPIYVRRPDAELARERGAVRAPSPERRGVGDP